jgi:hypothetical protein
VRTTRLLVAGLGLGCLACVGFMASLGHLEGPIDNAAPMWQPMAVYGVLGAAHLGAAAWLGPGRPASWTWAVCTVMFGLFNCVATPVVAYTLYRLFKVRPEVVSPRA